MQNGQCDARCFITRGVYHTLMKLRRSGMIEMNSDANIAEKLSILVEYNVSGLRFLAPLLSEETSEQEPA